MPSKDGRTTLAIVAASAGVSVATVSRVLNGRADVGPATRARVEALLRQHRTRGAAVHRPRAVRRIGDGLKWLRHHAAADGQSDGIRPGPV